VTTVLQYLVIATVIGLVLFGLALFLFGRGEQLAALPARTSPAELPDRDVDGSDVRDVRFALAVRGYRMSDVDWTLERLADELDRTKARLAELEPNAPQTLDPQSADTEPADTQSADTQRVDTQPVDTESTDTPVAHDELARPVDGPDEPPETAVTAATEAESANPDQSDADDLFAGIPAPDAGPDAGPDQITPDAADDHPRPGPLPTEGVR
jgi:DivIVA domain-containing protein